MRMFPDIQKPATSTVHAILDRHDLVKRRKRRRYKAQGTTLSSPTKPNPAILGEGFFVSF